MLFKLHGRQRVTENWWEGTASTAIAPMPASVVGWHNEIGGVAFSATLALCFTVMSRTRSVHLVSKSRANCVAEQGSSGYGLLMSTRVLLLQIYSCFLECAGLTTMQLLDKWPTKKWLLVYLKFIHAILFCLKSFTLEIMLGKYKERVCFGVVFGSFCFLKAYLAK